MATCIFAGQTAATRRYTKTDWIETAVFTTAAG